MKSNLQTLRKAEEPSLSKKSIFSSLLSWKKNRLDNDLIQFFNDINGLFLRDCNSTDALLNTFEKYLQSIDIKEIANRKNLISILLFIDKKLVDITSQKYSITLQNRFEAILAQLKKRHDLERTILDGDFESFLETILGSLANHYSLFIKLSLEKLTNLRFLDVKRKFKQNKIKKGYRQHISKTLENILANYSEQYINELKITETYSDDYDSSDVSSDDSLVEIYLTPPPSPGLKRKQSLSSAIDKPVTPKESVNKPHFDLKQFKKNWFALPFKWKLIAGIGFTFGVGAVVAGALVCPPSLIVTLPLLGKAAVSSMVIGFGTTLAFSSLVEHFLQIYYENNLIETNSKSTLKSKSNLQTATADNDVAVQKKEMQTNSDIVSVKSTLFTIAKGLKRVGGPYAVNDKHYRSNLRKKLREIKHHQNGPVEETESSVKNHL